MDNYQFIQKEIEVILDRLHKVERACGTTNIINFSGYLNEIQQEVQRKLIQE